MAARAMTPLADAPLPLDLSDAIEQAAWLRSRRYTWSHIAKIMADYHGQFYSKTWWIDTYRANGYPPLYPECGRNLPVRGRK